ncbi:MAG: glycosyltransferase family 4 protein, partial [Gemmatimonadales bacterium]
LLFLVTEDWYFASHRLPLARAAVAAGWCVSVATRVRSHGDAIAATGAELIPIGLRREGIGPFQQATVLAELVSLYRRLRPAVAHHVAMKPVLYGSFAARIAGTPKVVNAIAGLGYAFTGDSMRRRLIGASIRFGMHALLDRPGSITLLQNEDDRAMLLDRRVVTKARTRIIRGSGVDLATFAPFPPPIVPLVVLPARMLADKGVREFVEAARTLRHEGSQARFALVGGTDPANPSAIGRKELDSWVGEGVVEWWDHRSDMSDVLRQASVVCLPSYREGLPKALLEAAAAGRPIVTTDAPGCRDVVRDGWNGLLVPVGDPIALASALRRMLADPTESEQMGRRGRERAEREFDQDAVADATLALYEEEFA